MAFRYVSFKRHYPLVTWPSFGCDAMSLRYCRNRPSSENFLYSFNLSSRFSIEIGSRNAYQWHLLQSNAPMMLLAPRRFILNELDAGALRYTDKLQIAHWRGSEPLGA